MTATPSLREVAKPGVSLALVGGLPPIRGSKPVEAAAAPVIPLTAAPAPSAAVGQDISPSLARVLRPQAAYRWLLPYLSALTPLYIEGVLRGALAGNHVQAWELFDLMCDTNPEIRACVGEYVDGVTAKKLIVDAYCEENQPPSAKAIRNQRIVSAAFRNMSPDPANDENAIKETIRDIVFARFHGQSLCEIDYYETDNPNQLYTLNIAGVGRITAPRATFWVHPVCYAWNMEGRLGLRVALQNQIAEITQTGRMQQGKNRTYGGGIGSMTEPPAWNWITSQPMPSYLQEFPKNKFLIGVYKGKAGTALSGSDLRPLAAWWIYENFSADYAMDLAQIFAIPFRTATYSANTSEQDKEFVREMLQNMGSRGWALLPEGVSIQFEKAMASGGDSPQGFLIKLCHEQYRKVILRQTMTGSGHGGASSGSKAAMAQEGDVKAVCIQAGADFACSILREQFARYILRLNNPGGDDSELPIIRLLDKNEGSLADMERDQIGAQMVDIGEDYFRQKYGYPKPAAGEKIAGPPTPKPGASRMPKPAAGAGDPNAQPEPDEEMNAEFTRRFKRAEYKLRPLLEAAAAEAALSKDKKAIAQTAAETLSPLVKYLKAGMDIEDPAAQRLYFARALERWPELTKPIQHDNSLAEQLAPLLMQTFITGLSNATPGEASRPLDAGDVEGHEFHGNQFTEAAGKINDIADGKLDEAAYAKVSPDTADKIKAATGKDVTGYQHFIDRDALVHIDRQHGLGNEDQEGHLPITKEDIGKIPQIVAGPDSVVDGGTSARGLTTIKYAKRFNGTTYYVEEQWGKEKLLAAKTMFKVKTK